LIHRLAKFFVAFSRAQQYEILNLIVRKLALAKNRVRKLGRPAHGYFEADCRLRAWGRRLPVSAGAARNAPRPGPFRLLNLARPLRLGIIAAGVFVRGAIAEEGASP